MHSPVSCCCRFTSVGIWIYDPTDTVFGPDKDIPKPRYRLYLLPNIPGERQTLDHILIRFDSCPHKKRSFTVYKVELMILSYLLPLLSSWLLRSLPGCPISLLQHLRSFDTPASLPHHMWDISFHSLRDFSSQTSLAFQGTLSSSSL
jgi:hypothetical protein